jgi:hypothetical protein
VTQELRVLKEELVQQVMLDQLVEVVQQVHKVLKD